MSTVQEKQDALYATTPAINVSEKYQFVSTEKIRDLAILNGWSEYAYSQATARKMEFLGKQRHLLILSKQSYNKEDGTLQLAIRNSHNGTSSIQMFAGFMRIACSNQLFAKSFGDHGLEIRINHSGKQESIEQKVINGFLGMEENIRKFSEVIGSLKHATLTKDQIREFAEKSIYERFKYSKWATYTDFVPHIVEPIRESDTGKSAWNVLNTVQEKLVKGFSTVVKIYDTNKGEWVSKNFTSREIKSASVLPNFNDKLFEIMSNVLKN